MRTAKAIKWKKVDCKIQDINGNVYFSMKNVRTPESWSQLATDIAASKYFRKSGVLPKGHEQDIEKMIDRVVNQIVAAGIKQKLLSKNKNDSQSGQKFKSDLKLLLLEQKGFFNSPVWFNYGLSSAYGLSSNSPCFVYDKKLKKAVQKSDALLHPQVSACFIQSIDDSLEGIFELAKTEARLFKYGSGSGTNFSSLRSKYEKLESGGYSSGLISFLDVLDKGAGSVKSGGTTRRAAKMVVLDIDHPEILDFIRWKLVEEQKAKVLSQAGFGYDYEGDAYKTVSGQNANNTVRVSDNFLKALKSQKDWKLNYRFKKVENSPVSFPAKKIWSEIATAAWTCADPGLQFTDTINSWNTCKKSGEIRASNPCSEFLFLDNTACNLASLNLLKFMDEDGNFLIDDFQAACEVFFQAQEILVDDASYPTAKIAENSHNYRPLGLGICGLGAFLMKKAIAYDSEEGRAWASAIVSLLSATAYKTSAKMAEKLGAFSGYSKNSQSMLRVIKKHQIAAKKIKFKSLPQDLLKRQNQTWSEALTCGKEFGFRNAQATVLAPTGTIGLVMDAETTGIEPEFSLVKRKKLSGGGDLKMISSAFIDGLKRLGYNEDLISQIKIYVESVGSLRECIDIKPEHKNIFDTAMEISPEGHLLMMAALQPFVSGAISKTVNLPNNTSIQEIGDIYLHAWELGLKAVAIYRDGSKGSQPLNVENADKSNSEAIDKKANSVRYEFKPFEPQALPKCFECGAPTEISGSCYRCTNCGTVLGCS